MQWFITVKVSPGDPHFGFARVKGEECHHEYLLAFSCKCRHFCPSCHQKRVVEFGEWFFLHIIATDGCFYDQDGFMVGPQPDSKALEQAFRLEVFKMLKKEGKILSNVIDNMLG